MTDTIRELFQLLAGTGATVTFHGKPVTEEELRDIVAKSWSERIYKKLAQETETP